MFKTIQPNSISSHQLCIHVHGSIHGAEIVIFTKKYIYMQGAICLQTTTTNNNTGPANPTKCTLSLHGDISRQAAQSAVCTV